MKTSKLSASLLSLVLVAFIGGPVGAAHAKDAGKSKSKSEGHDKSKGDSHDHGKGNDSDDPDDDHDGDHDSEVHGNDFALFDGSNPLNQPNAGAVCGAEQGRPFTYYLAVANYGSAGFVRVTYADGDWVQYPIAAGGSFSLSQAAGSKAGKDRVVRVSNGGSAAQLAGVMSAQKAKCGSCDADGGIGDAGCDAFVPN